MMRASHHVASCGQYTSTCCPLKLLARLRSLHCSSRRTISGASGDPPAAAVPAGPPAVAAAVASKTPASWRVAGRTGRSAGHVEGRFAGLPQLLYVSFTGFDTASTWKTDEVSSSFKSTCNLLLTHAASESKDKINMKRRPTRSACSDRIPGGAVVYKTRNVFSYESWGRLTEDANLLHLVLGVFGRCDRRCVRGRPCHRGGVFRRCSSFWQCDEGSIRQCCTVFYQHLGLGLQQVQHRSE